MRSAATQAAPSSTHRRKTLFGAIGLPDTVEKICSSAAVRLAPPFHAASNWSAALDTGMVRTLAHRLRIVEHPFVDGGAHLQAAIRLIDVPPPQREQLATSKPCEQREPDQRPWQQPRQLGGKRRGPIKRECPFRSNRLQARHLDPLSGIRLQMPPFDRRPENHAQHVMGVVTSQSASSPNRGIPR